MKITIIDHLETDMIKLEKDQNTLSNAVTFHTNDDSPPLLEIKKNSFLVRGIPVPIDEKEAASVYKAFHQWLTWALLTQDDNR